MLLGNFIDNLLINSISGNIFFKDVQKINFTQLADGDVFSKQPPPSGLVKLTIST